MKVQVTYDLVVDDNDNWLVMDASGFCIVTGATPQEAADNIAELIADAGFEPAAALVSAF